MLVASNHCRPRRAASETECVLVVVIGPVLRCVVVVVVVVEVAVEVVVAAHVYPVPWQHCLSRHSEAWRCQVHHEPRHRDLLLALHQLVRCVANAMVALLLWCVQHDAP